MVYVSNISPTPKPSADAVGASCVLIVRPLVGKDVFLERDKASPSSVLPNNDFVEYVASIPPHPQAPRTPNREEMVELLKQVPYFTEVEPPVTSMEDFFLATKRITMDLDEDPLISFVARLPFNTLESVVSNIRTMQDYTIVETTKVVSLASL